MEELEKKTCLSWTVWNSMADRLLGWVFSTVGRGWPDSMDVGRGGRPVSSTDCGAAGGVAEWLERLSGRGDMFLFFERFSIRAAARAGSFLFLSIGVSRSRTVGS